MKRNFFVLCVLGLLTAWILFQLGPIHQAESYHDFADGRSWLGIANAENVLSNLFFAIVGFWGLYLLFSDKISFHDSRERGLWVIASLGMVLVAVASGIYHASPNNSWLFWDRAAIVLVFTSYTAALVSERYSFVSGILFWLGFFAFGIYSLFLWTKTGDLSLYLAVQIFTIILTLVMLFTPSPYTHKRFLGGVVFFYGMAVFFEMYDQAVFTFTHGLVSGHSLKHMSAAAAGACLIFMLAMRKKRIVS